MCDGGIMGVRVVYRVLKYTTLTHSTPPYHIVHHPTTYQAILHRLNTQTPPLNTFHSPTTQYKALTYNTPHKHPIHRYTKTVHRSTTQSRGREILISREGDNYFAGGRYLFRGREIIISREGLIISWEGDTYFAGGR